MRMYRYDRKYMDGRGFWGYLKKRLWIVILFAAVFCIVFAGKNWKEQKDSLKKQQAETELTLSEEQKTQVQKYLTDLDLYEQQSAYNQKALYMKIDPEQKYIGVLRYGFDQGAEGFWYGEAVTQTVNLFRSEDAVAYLEEQLAGQLSMDTEGCRVSDLLTFDTSTGQVLVIYVTAPDQEVLDVLLQATDQYLMQQIYPAVVQARGQFRCYMLQTYQYVARDTALRDTQASNVNLESTYATQKETDYEVLGKTEKKYVKQYCKLDADQRPQIGEPLTVEPVSDGIQYKTVGKQALKGLLTGGLAGLICLAFCFAWTGYIWTARNVKESFHIPFAWNVPKEENQMHLQFHFRNLTGKEDGAVCLLGTGVVPPEALEMMCHKVMGGTKLTVYQVLEPAVYEEKQAMQQLTEADAILLCLPAGKITYGELEHILENLAVYEGKILGAILL
ncbi:hypothetical protein KQI22_03755 [Kineothrix sp. MSJ-39]|uniref:hypothetical protein n=1 Tax=Kineothrix sp. MSJ-39 TaxID=2841533 RepID=UPI001C0FACB7|nr:hypothetical protein [Kineothrix sp. MSJ-39]MBU5429184.1 hypothetical protein [Kineothrix sp. MSJ-39]